MQALTMIRVVFIVGNNRRPITFFESSLLRCTVCIIKVPFRKRLKAPEKKAIHLRELPSTRHYYNKANIGIYCALHTCIAMLLLLT